MNSKQLIEIIRNKKKKAIKFLFIKILHFILLPIKYLKYNIFYRIKFEYTAYECLLDKDSLLYISEKYLEAVASATNLSKAGGIWELIVEKQYAELHRLLSKKDVDGLATSLKKFGQQPYTKGISLSGDIPKNLSSDVELRERFHIF